MIAPSELKDGISRYTILILPPPFFSSSLWYSTALSQRTSFRFGPIWKPKNFSGEVSVLDPVDGDGYCGRCGQEAALPMHTSRRSFLRHTAAGAAVPVLGPRFLDTESLGTVIHGLDLAPGDEAVMTN